MAYKLEIRAEADEEIFEAYNWYDNQPPWLGKQYLEELEAILQEILLNPQHYKVAGSVFRQASMKTFPFVVYFEITDDRIIVYSVFHKNRKTPKRF